MVTRIAFADSSLRAVHIRPHAGMTGVDKDPPVVTGGTDVKEVQCHVTSRPDGR